MENDISGRAGKRHDVKRKRPGLFIGCVHSAELTFSECIKDMDERYLLKDEPAGDGSFFIAYFLYYMVLYNVKHY
jgi:hypothetical protein